jgi:hypothetical protein
MAEVGKKLYLGNEPITLIQNNGFVYADPFFYSEVDPDATAFLTAAGITDPTISSAINTLVVDLKGYGIWTKMKAIYPFVGGAATTHKWNLKDPRDLDAAYRLSFFGTITHSSTGVKGDGSTGFYNTYLSTSAIGQNDISMFVYIRDNIAEDKTDIGALDSSAPYSGFQINSRGAANGFNTRCNSGGTIGSSASTDSRGLFGITRINSTEYKNSKNTTQTTISLASTGTKTRSIFGLCFSVNGTANFFSTRQQAYSCIGYGLTDTESDNLYTAVQAFQTTLSRQV